ncbi:MAG: pirin family protein [Acidobacteriota bacterium]
MITVRAAAERGRTHLSWLDSRHTFSFNRYHDQRWMGFGPVRVINDDRVVGGGGFGTHPHRDMEILSYVLSGALEHRDSLGTGSVIPAGDVQRMTAGSGIQHSEFNHSESEEVHFLQIWIEPERQGLAPAYEQRSFPREGKRGGWRLIASRDGRDGSLTIHRDVDVFATMLGAGEALSHELRPGRAAWLQVASGDVTLDGATHLGEGDGAAIERKTMLTLNAGHGAEVLLFDLPL